MATKPWSAYGIDQDSATAEEFKYVYHVAHLEDAIRIIEDGVIRASLVFDDSILKNTRTCVSWVSPNTWSPGSIYGNVAFAFRWKDIVKGKRIYWVEDPKQIDSRLFVSYLAKVSSLTINSKGIMRKSQEAPSSAISIQNGGISMPS